MSVRTTAQKSDTPKFNNIPMKTKHQFQVGFFKPSNIMRGDLPKLSKDINSFFTGVFENLNPDEQESIKLSTRKGGVFFVMAYHHTSTSRHLIAVVTFLADQDGIYINWLATTKDIY